MSNEPLGGGRLGFTFGMLEAGPDACRDVASGWARTSLTGLVGAARFSDAVVDAAEKA